MAFRLMLLIKMYDVTFKSMPGIVPARKLSKTINLLFIKTNHNSLSLHWKKSTFNWQKWDVFLSLLFLTLLFLELKMQRE